MQRSRRSGGSPVRAPSGATPSASAPLNSPLVRLTQKPSPASNGVSSAVMSAAPHAVALLQAQRVDRAVAAGDEPVLAPGVPQRAPQPGAVLGRAVQLPAELADERHAQRAHRHVADRHLAHAHVREVEGVGDERREDLRRARAPQREARPARGHVGAAHAAVAGRVPADPAEVVVAERRAGDDREQLLLDARDREVALDPAARVEHLRVRDRADARARPRLSHSRSRNVAAPGPAISSFANDDSSNRPARSRVARCSAPIAGDQCIPAQPRGRSDSSPSAALDSYQLTRSQPDFSPNAAPCAACHG